MSQPLAAAAKQWISLIQSRQFQQVDKLLQAYEFKDSEESKSKNLIKLLVYICQTAIECIKADPTMARDISKLCSTVCKNITSITNTGNFFSSLYHIIRVLLEANRFDEAMTICDFLLPTSIYYQQMMKRDNGGDLNEVYSKMWSIFYCSIDKYLKSLSPGSLIRSSFQQLLLVLEYQLRIELLSKSDGSKGLLLKLLHYREQLEHLKCTPQEIEEFTDKFYINFLSSVDLHLGDRNRLNTYQFFTKMINKCVKDQIMKENFTKIKSLLNKFLPNFESCMAKDEEIFECYQIHKEFCRILLRRFNEFTSIQVTAMQSLVEQLRGHIKLNGINGAVKYNIISLSVLLENVICYWMHSPNRPPEPVLINIVIKSADILDLYSDALANYNLESPCNCGSRSCSVYEDKQRAAHCKLQAMTMLQRLSSKENLNAELFEKYMAISSECINLLDYLRKCNCNRWKNIWNNAGISLYNFTVGLNNNYKEVTKLYTLLCQSIVRLKAMEPEYSLFKNNPTPQLSVVLHRLSSVHYTNKNFREAEAYAAINVFLYPVHPECKGYRNWSYVKYQDSESRNQSLIDYYHTKPRQMMDLRLDIDLTEGMMIDICLREIKYHVELKLELYASIVAALKTLESLRRATAIEYAFAVNQLGFYRLIWSPSDTEICEFVSSAIKQLKTITSKSKSKSKSSCQNHRVIDLLLANLNFHELLSEIHSLEKATNDEMLNSRVKLIATNSSENMNSKASNVIPAYSTINLRTATSIASKLDQMYYSWKGCVTQMSINEYNFPHGTIVPLRLIIIAGELSKFYRYKNVEIKFWKLAYNLATAIGDYRSIVYIVGRCLMSRYIKDEWIKNVDAVIETYLDSEQANKNTDFITTVSMYKMSLADYYYCTGRKPEADRLFEEANSIGVELDIGSNSAIYILSLYLVLTYQLPNRPMGKKNIEYTTTIAKILYTMITLDDLVTNFKNLEKNLHNLDMLLFVSSHVAIRLNSLYSFREVTAHLTRRLDICHTRISVLRAAEILKHLCMIDLSKNQLEDCEVKLQGLEHILQIDVNNTRIFDDNPLIIKSKSSKLASSPHERALTDPIRDIPRNDTSPVLRRERFAAPEFVQHDKSCKCFTCTNEAYSFLVFSCTHIRAQLYHLQNLNNYAREHFEGAWMIRTSKMNFISTKCQAQYQVHGYTIDYLLFLLDYVRFMKKNSLCSHGENSEMYLFEGLYLCELYQLRGHPIFLSFMEIIFEHRFQKQFSQGFPASELIYPRPDDIDISDYNELNPDLPHTLCITPAKEANHSPRPEKKSTPVRKNVVHPVSWTALTSDVVQVEEDDLSPVVTKPEPRRKHQMIRVKPVRRKLAEDADFYEEEKETKEGRRSRTKTAIVPKQVSMRDLIDEALSIAPGSTRKLHALRKKATDVVATDQDVKKLIEILVEVKTENNEKPRNRGTSRLEPSSNHLKGLNAMINKLNAMLDTTSTPGTSSASSNSRNSVKSSGEKAKDNDYGLTSLAKKIEKLSVNTAESGASGVKNAPANSTRVESIGKKSSSSVPEITISEVSNDDDDDDDDGDEIVESSITEPRRSRRLAGNKKTSTEAKPTINRL